MPLPRPQGAVAVAEVGAEVTVQQQLCSVLLVACPRPGGRRRGTSWHRDASAGYSSDLESLDFPADKPSDPLEGHDVALLALNTKR